MMFLKRSAAAAALWFGFSAAAGAQRTPNTPFSPEKIQQDIAFLSSSALEGRGSGTEGNAKAAAYLASEFKRYGLKPLGTLDQSNPNAPLEGKGYFQPFQFSAGRRVGTESKLTLVGKDKTFTFAPSQDFSISPLSAGGKAESADVVFAGYGISATSAARDDYAGVDISRKVVIVLPGSPKGAERFGELRAKVLTARDKGAVAVVTTGDETDSGSGTISFQNSSDSGIPVFQLKKAAFDELLASIDKSAGTVQTDVGDGRSGADLVPFKASFNADVHKIQKVTQNVVGMLEGTDYNLKPQFVLVGAHLDHLGMGGMGSLDTSGKPAVHPGADDNASGTAGVVELARYFSAHRPKRSLIFVLFSGEEMGLLGSAYYAKEPVVTLSNTVSMVNLDMIGRLKNNTLIVGGTGTGREFGGWLSEIEQKEKAAGSTLQISRSDTGFGASDHQSFYVKNTPVLFFFTGVHDDYHKPSDTADKINAEGEAQVLEIVRASVEKIANASEPPTYVRVKTAGAPGGSRGFAVYLGTVPNYAAEGVQGVLLDGVREGSPAEKAGLKAGDVIIRINNLVVNNLQDYVTALQQLKAGETAAITVKRGAENVTLNATLEERR